MARVHTITKSRKPQQCGRCGDTVPVGGSYRYFQLYKSAKRVRCMKTECSPRRSELTGSAIYSAAWDAQDALAEVIDNESTTIEALRDAVEECKDAVDEIVDEFEDKLSNIESGFGHTDLPIYEELEERKSGYEDWQSELEGVDVEDAEIELSIDRDDDPAIEVTMTLDEFDEEEVRERITETVATEHEAFEITDDVMVDLLAAARLQYDEALDTAREAARSANEACPE